MNSADGRVSIDWINCVVVGGVVAVLKFESNLLPKLVITPLTCILHLLRRECLGGARPSPKIVTER
jgi:hypothetical protein